jgi:hypothetical protein
MDKIEIFSAKTTRKFVVFVEIEGTVNEKPGENSDNAGVRRIRGLGKESMALTIVLERLEEIGG